MSSSRTNSAATLFLGDLSIFCTIPDLLQILTPFGPVEFMDIKTDPATGRCLNYGFVRFRNIEDANNAAEQLQGTVLHGREIKIGRAKGTENYRPVQRSASLPTHQLHCNFSSRQRREMITEKLLRGAFDRFGNVLDICIKKLTVNEQNNSQEGYAFIHFPDTPDGVASALAASAQMHKVVIGKVMYDCKPSHDFKRFLQLREEHTKYHEQQEEERKHYVPPGVSTSIVGRKMTFPPAAQGMVEMMSDIAVFPTSLPSKSESVAQKGLATPPQIQLLQRTSNLTQKQAGVMPSNGESFGFPSVSIQLDGSQHQETEEGSTDHSGAAAAAVRQQSISVNPFASSRPPIQPKQHQQQLDVGQLQQQRQPHPSFMHFEHPVNELEQPGYGTRANVGSGAVRYPSYIDVQAGASPVGTHVLRQLMPYARSSADFGDSTYQQGHYLRSFADSPESAYGEQQQQQRLQSPSLASHGGQQVRPMMGQGARTSPYGDMNSQLQSQLLYPQQQQPYLYTGSMRPSSATGTAGLAASPPVEYPLYPASATRNSYNQRQY